MKKKLSAFVKELFSRSPFEEQHQSEKKKLHAIYNEFLSATQEASEFVRKNNLRLSCLAAEINSTSEEIAYPEKIVGDFCDIIRDLDKKACAARKAENKWRREFNEELSQYYLTLRNYEFFRNEFMSMAKEDKGNVILSYIKYMMP